MSFQRSELLDRLPQQGWNLTNLEDGSPQLEWWSDEIWILECTWSPHQCRVYLTFLVDPDTHIQERKKARVFGL